MEVLNIHYCRAMTRLLDPHGWNVAECMFWRTLEAAESLVPAGSNAARKENRQRAYDDFIAVAEDLTTRKITSPKHLGIDGRSNGGLLMGVMLTQRPDLFGAVHCGSPLLDMRRYSHLLAGASWMDEYGDPDKADQWAYISKYSPYQNVRKDKTYPPILITTSTRDDRVHPGHARKMAALLKRAGA